MFYGRKESGEYIFAGEEGYGEKVYCPDCNAPLLMKKSKRGRYFFVHRQKCRKDYGEGSLHHFWKMYIAKQLQQQGAKVEMVLGNQRRADIFFKNIAIELQFSSIRCSELQMRIQDYAKLGIIQYWVFKWPGMKGLILSLSPMEVYIWKETKLPLLYIDQGQKRIIQIIGLQFIRSGKAICQYEYVDWVNVQRIERKQTVDFNIIFNLQQRWRQERKKQVYRFYKQLNYYQQERKQLYYLSQFGYTVENFGKCYTGNVYFIVSPLIWQIQIVYMYKIKKKTISECAMTLEKVSIIKNSKVMERIVLQVLAQFSVSLEDD